MQKCQHTAECQNLLVAFLWWKDHWCPEGVSLEVHADNIPAPQLIFRLPGSSGAVNKIARELALDLGDACFRPDVVMPTPGVASCIGDSLSRKFWPGGNMYDRQVQLWKHDGLFGIGLGCRREVTDNPTTVHTRLLDGRREQELSGYFC